MIDKMIAFGSGFDWITPLAAAVGRTYLTVSCHEDWRPIIESMRYERRWRIKHGWETGDQMTFRLHKNDKADFERAMAPYGWERTK